MAPFLSGQSGPVGLLGAWCAKDGHHTAESLFAAVAPLPEGARNWRA